MKIYPNRKISDREKKGAAIVANWNQCLCINTHIWTEKVSIIIFFLATVQCRKEVKMAKDNSRETKKSAAKSGEKLQHCHVSLTAWDKRLFVDPLWKEGRSFLKEKKVAKPAV